MPEEKCLLRFADQFNYGFTNSKVNESFEFDDDRVQKFYDVKREDGVPLKYNVYLINEPTPSSCLVNFRKRPILNFDQRIEDKVIPVVRKRHERVHGEHNRLRRSILQL